MVCILGSVQVVSIRQRQAHVGLSVLKKVGGRKILGGDEFFREKKEENFLKRRRFSKPEWRGGRIFIDLL